MPRLWLNKKGVRAAFLTREEELAGYQIRPIADLPTKSDEVQVLEHNRILLTEYFECPGLTLSMGKQVHGNHVSYTGRPEVLDQTDGLVTDYTGLAIGVLVADCAAVLMTDRVHKVVAAVHAGWRGTVDGILQKAITKMMKLGAEPDVMEVYISPCISQESFEVGEKVASRFPHRFIDYSRPKPHIDLRGYIQHELTKLGVSQECIVSDKHCTVQHPETLHSYRRDGKQSGRMMAVIALK